ncbi:MAG: lactate racemase domain-containing protein [Thermodesulfovibrionales bacterium]
MKTIPVPSGRWHENKERELTFPSGWEVANLTSPGFDRPALSPGQIKRKLMAPAAGPSLEELAKGKKEAVIVFDDMTRPTPVGDVAVPLLEILHAAGITKERIRFVWALGTHAAYDMSNARKKLGDEIVENYAVYNHDPFQNTVLIGRTPAGTELWFNREVMNCDLKIGIGCTTPHPHVGFSGGAKIVMPGVAGIETTVRFHDLALRNRRRTGLGNFDNNIMREECDAAGEMMGLNFKVDCLINRRGGITGLYAGPFREVHAAAAEAAREHYGIPFATGFDVVVCNAYGKATEAAIAALVALPAIRPDGNSSMVLIIDAPEGQVPHYVMRCWGTGFGGRHYEPKIAGKGLIRTMLKKLIVFAPHPDPTMLDLLCHPGDAVVVKTWCGVREILERDYPPGARASVIQDGTMQYMKR